MDVVGVIDVRNGTAVHAQGGIRKNYLPARGGDPVALARWYVEECAVSALYFADLDAIGGAPIQQACLEAVVRQPVPVWVDAGIRSADVVCQLFDTGVERVVAGLETLRSMEVLDQLVQVAGGRRILVSIDVRSGQPLGAVAEGQSVEALAFAAERSGVGGLIGLDLAHVGSGRGANLGLLDQISGAAKQCQIIAGGGIRDVADLVTLHHRGCSGALVATALQAGRLARDEVIHARSWR